MIHPMLLVADARLSRRASDDLASGRVMRVAISDFANVVLMKPLVRTLRAKAPSARFALEIEDADSVARLEDGSLDLVIGQSDPRDTHHVHTLLEDELVFVVKNDHPLAARPAPVTAADLVQYQHVECHLEARRERPLDAYLADRGLARRVPVSCADYWSALQLAAHGDLVLSIPSRVLACLKMPQVVTLATDLPTETVSCRVMWHSRCDRDPCVRFLLSMLADTAAAP